MLSTFIIAFKEILCQVILTPLFHSGHILRGLFCFFGLYFPVRFLFFFYFFLCPLFLCAGIHTWRKIVTSPRPTDLHLWCVSLAFVSVNSHLERSGWSDFVGAHNPLFLVMSALLKCPWSSVCWILLGSQVRWDKPGSSPPQHGGA